jgi:hypothetical protein
MGGEMTEAQPYAPRAAYEDGWVARPDQFLEVRREIVDDGDARGSRTVSVRPMGGLQARILLDRGMDIGSAWYAGTPVSWGSAVGESAPGRSDVGQGWLDGWSGGLVTTCGLRNVGAPGEGHGQHGSFTDLAASEVTVRRFWLPDGEAAVEIAGVLTDASALGRQLRVERRIRLRTGRGELTVTDTTTNCGPEREQAPFLYHLNLGYPFLSANSEVRGAGMDDGWQMGPVRAGEADTLLERTLPDGETAPELWITGPDAGLEMRVSWSGSTLPRLHTWRRRTPRSYVMSIEPANCGLGGRAADRDAGRAPFLEPGQERTTSLTVVLQPLGSVH